MDRLLAFSVRQFFGGARRGQPLVTGLAAAVTLFGLARRFRRGEALLYRRTMREGEAIRLRVLRGGEIVEDTEVEGSPVTGK